MILNSDVTQKPILVPGNPSKVSPSDYLNNLKDKALNWHPTKMMWIFMVGAVVVMIIEKKLNLKAKKYNFNFGGKK